MSRSQRKKVMGKFGELGEVGVWRVAVSNGDVFGVFARNGPQAVQIVADVHFPRIEVCDFISRLTPIAMKIPGNRKLHVYGEDGVLRTKTAGLWAEGERPGAFFEMT